MIEINRNITKVRDFTIIVATRIALLMRSLPQALRMLQCKRVADVCIRAL